MFLILCVLLHLGVVKTNNLVQAYRKDVSSYPRQRVLSNTVKKLFKNMDDTHRRFNVNSSIDKLIYGEVSEPYAYDYSEVWWTANTKKEVKKVTVKLYHRDLNGTLTTPTNNVSNVATTHASTRETLKPIIIKKKIKVVDRLSKVKRKRPLQRNQDSNNVKKMKKTMITTTHVAPTKQIQRDSEKLIYVLNRDDAKGDLSIKSNDTDIMVDARKNISETGMHASVMSGLLFKNETVFSDFDYIIYDRTKNHGAGTSDESYGVDLRDLDRTDDTAPIIIKVMKPEETAEGLEKFKKGAQMLIGPENTGKMPKVDKEGIYRIEVTEGNKALNINAGMANRNVDPRFISQNQMPPQARQSFNQNRYKNNNQNVIPNSNSNSFNHNYMPNHNVNAYRNPQGQSYNPNAPFGPNSNKGHYGQNFNKIHPYGPNTNRNPYGQNFSLNKRPFGPNSRPNRNPYPNFPPDADINPFDPNFDSNEGPFGPPGPYSNRNPYGPNSRPNPNRNPFGPNSHPNFNRNPFGPNFDPNKSPFGPSSRPNSNRNPYGSNSRPNPNRNPYGPNFPTFGNRRPNGPNFSPNADINPFNPNFDPNKTPFGPSSRPNSKRNPYVPNLPPHGNRGPNFTPIANRNPFYPNVPPNGKGNPFGSFPSNADRFQFNSNFDPNFNRNPLDHNVNLNTKGNPFNQNFNPTPNGMTLHTKATESQPPKHDHVAFIKDQNSSRPPDDVTYGHVQNNKEGANTNVSNRPFRDDTRQAKELKTTHLKQPTPSVEPTPDPHIDPEAYLPTIVGTGLYEGMGLPGGGITEEVTAPTTTTKVVKTTPRTTIDMHTERVTGVETRPSGFGRRKTTRHPSFGTTPEKLSPFVHELLDLMVELNAGYFTVAVVGLLDTMALMPSRQASVLFTAYEIEVDTMINLDHMYDLGRDLIMALQRLAEYITTTPVDVVQEETKIIQHAMLNRRESLTLDINSIIDYIDNIFIEEEGIKLFKVIEKVHDYPKGKITARLLHRELTDALYHPLVRLHKTAKKQILIDSINKLIDNHMHAPPIHRRQSKLRTSNTTLDEDIEDDLSVMNNYRYYKKRFKHYKRKIGRTKKSTVYTSETRKLRNGTMSGYSTVPYVSEETIYDNVAIVSKKASRTTKSIKSTTSRTTPTLTTTLEETNEMDKLKQKQSLRMKKNKNKKQKVTTTEQTTKTTTTTTTEMQPALEEAKMITTNRQKYKKKDSEHKRKIVLIKKKKLRRLKSKHPKLFKKYFKRKKHEKHKKDRIHKIHMKRHSKLNLAKLKKVMQQYKSVERQYKGLIKQYTEKIQSLTSVSNAQTPAGINDDQLELMAYDNMNYPRNHPTTIKPIKHTKIKPEIVDNMNVAQKWQTKPTSLQNPVSQNFSFTPIIENNDPDDSNMMLSQKFENFKGILQKSKKTTSNKLLQPSSYSDDEDALNFNINDAMRHDTTNFKARRHNDENNKRNTKSLNVPSSYSNEEVVLKSKIYEGFVFNKSYVSDSSTEVYNSNDKDFKANNERVLSRTDDATSYYDTSSYSDEEELIKKNLKL